MLLVFVSNCNMFRWVTGGLDVHFLLDAIPPGVKIRVMTSLHSQAVSLQAVCVGQMVYLGLSLFQDGLIPCFNTKDKTKDQRKLQKMILSHINHERLIMDCNSPCYINNHERKLHLINIL